MADAPSREGLRLGLLLFAGFALVFAVMAVVVGNHLDHLDVGFAAQDVEMAHQRLQRGDARFEYYRWLWRGTLGLLALACAGFAVSFWRALKRTGAS